MVDGEEGESVMGVGQVEGKHHYDDPTDRFVLQVMTSSPLPIALLKCRGLLDHLERGSRVRGEWGRLEEAGGRVGEEDGGRRP